MKITRVQQRFDETFYESNWDQDLKRSSSASYKGPTIPITSSPKVVEREPEVSKDTMLPTNNGSTKDVQPSIVPVVHHESILQPVNAPVSAQGLTKKQQYPFSFRRMMKDVVEKANDQIEKF
ncbi:hypothetical protein Tco_0894050 [Tanacetum coccineum]|uniref:Uncharacterized protein n=1 Tax=Tanacetum coccineum TaxID=301880 RepID=A0ABQ5CBX0_9ASTR